MQALPVYTDFNSLNAITTQHGATEREKLENAAQQFAAVFTNMLLKSMRQASLGEGIFDNEQSEMYRDLFDQQISLQLNQGQSLGIAELLVNQFTNSIDAESASADAESAASSAEPGISAAQAAASSYQAVQRMGGETQDSAVYADTVYSILQDT